MPRSLHLISSARLRGRRPLSSERMGTVFVEWLGVPEPHIPARSAIKGLRQAISICDV